MLALVVPAFASSDGSKLERTLDEGIKMCDVKPFPKRQKIMAFCVVVRCVRWMNKVCICGQRWVKNILATMKLDPITLVDCIVLPFGWMANVKFEKEMSIQHARRVN